MISPERIEAAARAIGGYRSSPEDDDKWEMAKKTPYGTMCFKQATDALAAAFPELASDPPKAWLECAARAICETDPLSPSPDAPISWNMKPAKAWEPRAAILKAAVEAGLFCHPPKAWVAPIELTEPMWEAVQDEVFRERTPEEVWGAARDASLKEQAG